MDFRITQFLTGHGCFADYLTRINKTSSNICIACESDLDSPEHTLVKCTRWDLQRGPLSERIGEINLENLVSILKDPDKRPFMADFINEIMKSKETIESDKQRQEKREKFSLYNKNKTRRGRK